MTKEERLAKRKADMKRIKKNLPISKVKPRISANERRDKRNADFSAKVKEVNSNKKAKQKLKDEKRIAARNKVVNRITTDKNKRIAADKDRRATNRKKIEIVQLKKKQKKQMDTLKKKLTAKSKTPKPGNKSNAPNPFNNKNKPTSTRRKGPGRPTMTSMVAKPPKPRNKNVTRRPKRPSKQGSFGR